MFYFEPTDRLAMAVAVSPVIRCNGEFDVPTRYGPLLAAVASMAPGPNAIAMLDRIVVDMLNDVERTEYLVAWERCGRWVEAQRAKAVVAVAGPVPDRQDDFPREMVKAALADAGGSARADVDLARAIGGHLAVAGQALAAGEISYAHVRVLVTETAELTGATAATVAAQVLATPVARRSLAEFRRVVKRAVIRADPLRAELAAERANAARAVSRQALPEAQAALTLTGPALGVATIWTAADAYAAHPGAGDARTLDQRRFDALVDICRDVLAAPAVPAGRRGLPPTVHLYADLPTWAGLADSPVELEGYGVIPAGLARQCFTDARWRAVVTSVAGEPVRVADATYTPSAATNRLLAVRDRRCGFPGCGAAIWFCDADHNVPHAAGGGTDADNCGLLCRRHHRLKTFTDWSWRRGADGSIVWTDPHGAIWEREPIRYPMPPRPETPEPGDSATSTDPPASSATPLPHASSASLPIPTLALPPASASPQRKPDPAPPQPPPDFDIDDPPF